MKVCEWLRKRQDVAGKLKSGVINIRVNWLENKFSGVKK